MRPRMILAHLLSFTAFLLPFSAQAEDQVRSANKIIDAYVRAEGGAKRLAQQRAVEFQGTATDEESKATGSFTLILEKPNRLYREVTIGSQTTRESNNGKSAWRQDSSGLRTLTGEDGGSLKTEARLRNQRFVDYKKDKDRVQWVGDETVRGHAAHKVEVVTASNVHHDVYFDSASGLIVEDLTPPGDGNSAPQSVYYDDYRPVDGIPEPFRMEFEEGTRHWTVTIGRVAHNPAVDELAFAFPAASSRPLPEIADLLKAVDRNQKAIDKLVEQYTCDKTEEQFELDAHGNPKSKEVKTYNVFYLDGDEVDRLISKNGH